MNANLQIFLQILCDLMQILRNNYYLCIAKTTIGCDAEIFSGRKYKEMRDFTEKIKFS